MAIQFGGGERLNLWDMFSADGENHYATVLYPDGHQSIVPITPVARGASDFWTSPVTGQRYATHWIVRIPFCAHAWTSARTLGSKRSSPTIPV